MPDLASSREKYGQRVRAVKERMSAQGIDVLVITEPPNLFYTTGYDAYSFYVVQVVLIAVDSDLPIWSGGSRSPSHSRSRQTGTSR